MSSIWHNVMLRRFSTGCPSKWFSQVVENLVDPRTGWRERARAETLHLQ